MLLVLLRSKLKGIFKGHVSSRQDTAKAMDEFAGQKAVVKKTIVAGLGGKVEFHGTNWRAEADEEIAQGAVVEILSKENLTLKVKVVDNS